MPRVATQITIVSSLVVAAFVVGACAPQDSGKASTDSAQYCKDYKVAVDAFLNSPVTGDDQALAKMEKSAISAEAKKLGDAIRTAQAGAPATLAEPFKQILAVVDAAAASGDTSQITGEALMTQGTTLDAWAYDNCGWPQVVVTAQDYAFPDFPATIPAGTTAFKMNNTATDEEHVMLIARRKPGVTASAAELMSSQGDPFEKLDLLAATGAKPGQSAYAFAGLTPGSYIAFCPIPQAGKPDGQSHAALGMVSEFTVP